MRKITIAFRGGIYSAPKSAVTGDLPGWKTKSEAMTIAVVHLVRSANSFADFRQFLDSYDKHSRPEDVAHELLFAFKGFDQATLAPYLDALVGRPCQYRLFPDTGFDIGIYFQLAESTDYPIYVFCNSFTCPAAEGWVGKLTAPLGDPSIAISGASGSWEQIDTAQPWPNTHVRTTGFAMRRADFLSLSRPPAFTQKRDTNEFEAGPQGATRQMLERGRKVVVVDRDGKAWPPDAWPGSRTFRPSDRALMIDGRMRVYDEDTPEVRRWLADLAWTENPVRSHPAKRRKIRRRIGKLLKGIGRAFGARTGKAV